MLGKLKAIIIFVAVVISVIIFYFYYIKSPVLYITDFVVDGDTIKVRIGYKSKITIRYGCIDTPEHNEPFFYEAYSKNKEIVLGQLISFLTLDNDRYGRKVALVRVSKSGLRINEELLRQGLAVYYNVSGKCSEFPELLTAQKYAFDNRLGLWNLYYKYKDTKFIKGKYTFHLDSCDKIKSYNKQFLTLQKAVYLGLSPCRYCKPLLTLYLKSNKK